jgi:hypothetical protein
VPTVRHAVSVDNFEVAERDVAQYGEGGQANQGYIEFDSQVRYLSVVVEIKILHTIVVSIWESQSAWRQAS